MIHKVKFKVKVEVTMVKKVIKPNHVITNTIKADLESLKCNFLSKDTNFNKYDPMVTI